MIGRGGCGCVFLCEHNLDKRQYAVKIISLRFNEVENEKIKQEVRIFANLNSKYICRYNNVRGEQAGVLYSYSYV